MAFGAFVGAQGHALSSLEWLLLHHRAKQAARQRIADRLCLFPGMSVIDLGCGPGLWSNLLAEQVGPHGSVVGIDVDETLVDYALLHAKEGPGTRPTFEVGDFGDLSKFRGRFDAAFSANCFAYYDRPESLIREFRTVLKPNGILICRHFDNTFWLASPIDPALTAAVFHGTARAGKRDATGAYFDNNFGQVMHCACRKAGLENVRTESVSIDLCGPLSRAARDYLTLTAEWTAEIAREGAGDGIVDAWLAHFDPRSEAYVLDSDDCLFTFLEYTAVGFAGAGSDG